MRAIVDAHDDEESSCVLPECFPHARLLHTPRGSTEGISLAPPQDIFARDGVLCIRLVVRHEQGHVQERDSSCQCSAQRSRYASYILVPQPFLGLLPCPSSRAPCMPLSRGRILLCQHSGSSNRIHPLAASIPSRWRRTAPTGGHTRLGRASRQRHTDDLLQP
jgi:hypothetical protein